jgi:hypothetical protein
MALIKSTVGQRRQVGKNRTGTGFIVWKSTDSTTTELEFFIKDGKLFNVFSGKELSFEYGKQGLIRAIET